MDKKCGFCLEKLKKDDFVSVKELMIDTHPRIVKFTDILFDLFYCETDVSKICPKCLDLVNKQYLFKEKLRKVVKMPLPKHVEVIKKVQQFLSKTEEMVRVETHMNIMSIVPESRSQLMTSIQKFTPDVQLIQTTLSTVKSGPPVTHYPAITTRIKNSSIAHSSNRIEIPIFYGDDRGEDSGEEDSGGGSESDDKGFQVKKTAKRKRGKGRSRAPKKLKVSNGRFVKQEPKDPLEERETLGIKPEPGVDNNDHVLNSSRLVNTLSDEQKKWLEEKLQATIKERQTYTCSLCSKAIKSFFGINYHYIHLHMKKKPLTASKMWVSIKVREGSKIIQDNDGNEKLVYQCSECTKVYQNQPGLRYHLLQHLKEFEEEDDYHSSDDSVITPENEISPCTN